MGDVMFYHLTRSTLPAALGMLLEKSLARGWRVAVRGRDRAALETLDAALWLGPDERFLPHGLAGGPHDARQPILLTDAAEAANAPDCLMLVDGADLAPEEPARLERVCIVFDGGDGDQVAHARGQWRAVKAAGATAQYWSEESGRWEKKAQAGG
ncbi:MAG: DNA polymerase III subunit chi [Deinococcus-Thermus bacterium]|jgi:DNA polymerase-3 subunit chi|nr:DNA polymerase III subunit chi [Deinococcota bacterium]